MILMHKDIPVAEMTMIGTKPYGYKEIYAVSELPLGTKGNGPEQDQLLLNKWFGSRSIPHLRPNLSQITAKLGMPIADAFMKSAGVSLTDTYWFKEKNQEILWDDINFHKNGFEPVLANIYMRDSAQFAPSPDFTTDGMMEKFWFPIYNMPYLFKMDNLYQNTLCANELVYFQIAGTVGIQTTPYFDGQTANKLYCFCPCFVKKDNCDFVNAMQINHMDFSLHGNRLIKFFSETLGFEKQIKEMFTLDCVLGNTDRHEKNFGFLQFEDGTKQFVPLFDNGSCLDYDYNPIRTDKKEIKPLRLYREQILEQYGLPLEFDRLYCNRILEQVYSDFQIPEIQLEIAKKELERGIELVERHSPRKYVGHASVNKEDYEHAHD